MSDVRACVCVCGREYCSLLGMDRLPVVSPDLKVNMTCKSNQATYLPDSIPAEGTPLGETTYSGFMRAIRVIIELLDFIIIFNYY